MVYKVGKYGTRSGNTFRVKNKRFSQRYRRNAYIVRSHTVQNGDPNFDTTGIFNEGKAMIDGVQYSLNKQNRWELPSIIEELIINGDHDDDYSYLLIQRHSLLKTSNCVSVAATDGVFHQGSMSRERRFKIKNCGGHFQSASVLKGKPSLSKQEKRERRRQQRTTAANPDDDINQEENVENLQIRYDVLYPAPDTGFLAHDPKSVGINTRRPFVYQGMQDKTKKAKKRTRFIGSIKEQLHIMDQYDNEDNCFEEENTSIEDSNSEYTVKDYNVTLDDIMKHANTAQELLTLKKLRRFSGSSYSSENEPDSKQHIVYCGENPKAEQMTDVMAFAPKIAKGSTRAQLDMKPVIVILNNLEVTPTRLAENYGKDYFEANCLPRKFIINISCSLLNTKTQIINCFLVFVQDVYNEINTVKESVFHVFLNAQFNDKIESVKMETVFDYSETNITELIERARFYFETLPLDAFEVENVSCNFRHKPNATNVEKCSKWKAKAYQPTNMLLLQEMLAAFNINSEEMKDFDIISASEFLDDEGAVAPSKDQFCSICYEELENMSSTALLSCKHWFCAKCWREYLRELINHGELTLRCPEYKCDKVIDPVTLLSLAEVCDVIRHARHVHDNQVEVCKTNKWCPNEKCGRVIQVNTEEAKFTQCVCGEKFCMQCLGKSHWPAPCEAVQAFTTKLRKTGDITLIPGELVTTCTVNGKNCPECNRFVEKNGGCPYMYCICGTPFCWGCGKLWGSRSHDASCYKNGYKDKHGTTPFVIELERIEDKKREAWYKKAVRHRINQHPGLVSKMRTKLKGLTHVLQTYIVKSNRKGQNVSIDLESENANFRSEVEKVRPFLSNTLDMYVEVNHVVENTALLVGLTQLPSNLKPRLQYIINRLAFFAESINGLLIDGAATISPGEVLQKLSDIRFHCKQCLQSLIKLEKLLQS